MMTMRKMGIPLAGALCLLPANMGHGDDLDIPVAVPEVQGFRDSDFQPEQDIPRIIRWITNQYLAALSEQDRTLTQWSEEARMRGEASLRPEDIEILKARSWEGLRTDLPDNLMKIMGNFLKLERDAARLRYELAERRGSAEARTLRLKSLEAEQIYQDFLNGFLPPDLMGTP